MIINTICLIIAVALVILCFKYFTGRKKTYSAKSTSEKLASTLKSKLSKNISDLNNGLRTPEVIEVEINETLSSFYAKKAEEFKSIFANYTEAITSASNMINQLASSKHELETKLTEIKKNYESGKLPQEEALNLVKMTQRSLKSINDMLETAKKRASSLEKDKESIKSKMEIFITAFNVKKISILSQIASLKTSALNSSINVNINIDDLLTDFNVTVTKQIDNNEVDNKFYNNGSSMDFEFVDDGSYSDEDAKAFLGI